METAVQRLPIHAEPLLQQWTIILFESITIIFDFVVTVNQTLSTYTNTAILNDTSNNKKNGPFSPHNLSCSINN